MASRFDIFRRKLADYTTQALCQGIRIGPSKDGCQRCPLGCLPEAIADNRDYPFGIETTYLTDLQSVAFASGFDGNSHTFGHPQHHNLGRLYRERFSRKAAPCPT